MPKMKSKRSATKATRVVTKPPPTPDPVSPADAARIACRATRAYAAARGSL